MTNRDAQVQRLTETLKTSVGKRIKWPLRRHHDDWYHDRVEVTAGEVSLLAVIVPRYKTSGLSGDEWRVSSRIQVAAGVGTKEG